MFICVGKHIMKPAPTRIVCDSTLQKLEEELFTSIDFRSELI